MAEQSRSPPTHFFTLRLWSELAEDNEAVWRGRIHCPANGEVHYFQGWEVLIEKLLLLMEAEGLND